MRILVVSQCFNPDIYAINDIVKTLVERGHIVTVLTGLPDYTTSRIPKEYKYFHNRHQNFCGAEVFRVSTIARHQGAMFRCLNYLSFVISGCLFARFHHWDDFDAIYVWEVSPVTMAIPAITLKKRYHKPLFLYCMDLWPESIKAMGFREKSFFYRVVHKLSKWIYAQCDHIAVSSKPFVDYLKDINDYSPEKMSYLPQYAPENFLHMDLQKAANGHFDFLFIGNVGKVQDVECVIKACALLLKKYDVTIHIVGGGSNFENCQLLAKELHVDTMVQFYGSVPQEETPEFYKTTDACLLTLKGDSMIGTTLPGKLQTYMAAGKPIIGAINGAGQEVISESKCGLCGKAGDSKALAQNMKKFMEHSEKYRKCGENGRTYFKRFFSKCIFFENFEATLGKLSDKSNFNITCEVKNE
ncbi:MAG: glycosyltransferase family 4 protein [Ruthenibacterium sp.]